jgi:hypothetical protein
MSMLERPHSARFYKLVVLGEVVLLCAIVALAAYTYGQSQTTDRISRNQHQICQLFTFVGDRTQQQIDLTAARLKVDLAHHLKTAVRLDRKSISDATSFLIRVLRVQC